MTPMVGGVVFPLMRKRKSPVHRPAKRRPPPARRRIFATLIERAIEMKGSADKLAKACNVVVSAITNLKLRGGISPELAIAIHRATEGEVSGDQLRPDLWARPEHVPVKLNGGKDDSATGSDDRGQRQPEPGGNEEVQGVRD